MYFNLKLVFNFKLVFNHATVLTWQGVFGCSRSNTYCRLGIYTLQCWIQDFPDRRMLQTPEGSAPTYYLAKLVP